MGGSGGSGSTRPRLTLREYQDRARRQTDLAAYDTEVEGMLRDALASYNDRDAAGIQRHLQTIEQALSKEIEGSVRLLFGGSIIKHTYVNGLSDVDMLVSLNDTSLAGRSPGEAMAYFMDRLHARLPNTRIRDGKLAVTVTFSDGHQIQLLPAIRTGSGYRIAASDGQRWSQVVAPERFARRLTAVNQSHGGKVVPIIKLYKVLNDSLPKPSRLSGYHIESLAIEAFSNYEGRQTLKTMLHHFCAQAQSRVMRPISDRTGQSRHVDDALGAAASHARRRASQAIANLRKKIERADAVGSTDTWKEMFLA